MTDTNETFDTPSGDEVLQLDDPMPTVPVAVQGIVQTDEMPTRWGYMGNKLLHAGGNPVSLLPYHPQRKRVILWTYYLGAAPADTAIGAMIGPSFADVSGFNGAILLSLNAITRYEFTGNGELWARGVDVRNVAGALTEIDVNSNDVLVNIVTEDWAR